MRSLALLLLVATTPLAYAETWAVASIASYHFERKGYCEFNPGIGIEHQVPGNTRIVFGQYSNSFCRTSAYIGLHYTALTYGNWKFGGALIAVTGYEKKPKTDKNEQEILIAPLPVIGWEGKRYGFNLIFAPPDGTFAGAIGVQAKLRF